MVGTEEEKTLAVCTIGEALRQDKAGSPKRCAIKEKVARLWFKTVFHKGIVPILRSLAASNAESFAPPPTVSLLGSRLLWMCHNCWIPNLKEMRPFYFSAGLRQQLQSESNIYLRRATASLTFNTGHKNITIKALKSAVKHGVTCHWDLLLLLLLPLLYPLLMAKQRLISKPPEKKKEDVFSIKLRCSTKLALLKATTLQQCRVTSSAICRAVFLTLVITLDNKIHWADS